ncbi:MAG TPA: pyridoxamine 5'-phosphate oxidase family protein [Acidimicrobiales bacterium]|nr:pyridoxamine 5'-phosphate oxidase family protein [Acidimicrobiales bacterium]
MSERDPRSERTTLHRYAHRAAYDRATVDAILDEGFVCHVGLSTSAGYPVVIPLAYGRDGDVVYLHGSAASRLFRGARSTETEICMTVTFVDGLVVARSTYNTDINYRSVVIIGPASEVKDLGEKRAGLELMVDHIIPGRSRDARPPTEKELRSTMLLRLPLGECSAKVRTGWPLDEEEDYDLPIWAGVIPLTTVVERAVVDPALRVDAAMPSYVEHYRRPAPAVAMAGAATSNGSGAAGAAGEAGAAGAAGADREAG